MFTKVKKTNLEEEEIKDDDSNSEVRFSINESRVSVA